MPVSCTTNKTRKLRLIARNRKVSGPVTKASEVKAAGGRNTEPRMYCMIITKAWPFQKARCRV